MSTRLSVNINDEVAETLRGLSDDLDVPVTEVVRRVVSTYWFFNEQVAAGKRIELVDGREVLEVHLP